ncbi:RNA polymerase sigma factor (sigma-70 family) [Herbihabitans rhizosphaerae]|uniref:RNA polymerase sigma factor (Sigma-70 family) n=1 Tax=Herbihabitans rhizosphaerae TaxID=1872711 RepID=A0A4Q7KVM2_9PSEU|nr:sigma-70 family RNA polymerase sigma factor [Herbihabitans rhizosphaerae]RZS40764.1 RNA polymerase sigma factor (sigma-70 family) [Herbihabitans rhizosphaerae]
MSTAQTIRPVAEPSEDALRTVLAALAGTLEPAPPPIDSTLDAIRSPLLRRAFRLCGCRDQAEDLVQSTFERLLSRRTTLTGIGRLESYAQRVLHSIFVDERRTSGRAREVLVANIPELSIPVPDDDGESTVLQRLAELPTRQKIALWLRFGQDLSVEETATRMGCTASSVTSQTSRGLRALRTAIAG